MTGETRIELMGASALIKEMKLFGPKVSQRAADTGVRKAAMFLGRKFRAAAPKISGRLRKSIKMKYSRRSGRAWVGLRMATGETKILYYYKTLEFNTKRGSPLSPFFTQVWDRHKKTAADMIISKTRDALFEEAGKQYARTKARNK